MAAHQRLKGTRTTRLFPSLCPLCGYATDAATDMDGRARPKPGDWSLCLNCAGLLQFGPDMRLVQPPPGTFEAAAEQDPEFRAAIEKQQAAIRLTHTVLGRPKGAGGNA